MADSWDAVREGERRSGQTFGTFLFSRTDLVFIRPMGAWDHYVPEPGTPQPWYWHSAGTGTPDIFWIMSRDVAHRVLGQSLSAYLECTTAEPCCNLRTWAFSWWIPAYWFRAKGFFPCAPLLGSAMASENRRVSRSPINGTGRETLGTRIARGVRSGFGESESAHAVVSESRSLSRATLAGALTLFASIAG